jgi:hypothetical protein
MATETEPQRPGNTKILAQLNGSIALASILIFIDVVVEGCYEFSPMVCPVWLAISLIKGLVKRASPGIAAARLLIPIATLLLVLGNYFVQTRIAWANSATLIQACESYHKDNGKYPDRLDQLVPRYLSSVPSAKYCLMCNDFQ